MKDMDLLKAVGQIDDKFIEEADEAQAAQIIELRTAKNASAGRSTRRAERRRRWVSVAASLAVVVAIGALIANGSLGGFGGAASKNDRMYSRNTAPANNSMPMPEANTAAEDNVPDLDSEPEKMGVIDLKGKDGQASSQSTSSLQNQSVSDGVDSIKGLVSDDFSFAITWNAYGVSSYDSRTGVLIKDNSASRPSDYTASHVLTAEEKERIYELITYVSIDSVRDLKNSGDNAVVSSPRQTLYLTVRDGIIEKTAGSEDAGWIYVSDDERVKTFRDVCSEIISILEETPEWKALPDYENYYL